MWTVFKKEEKKEEDEEEEVNYISKTDTHSNSPYKTNAGTLNTKELRWVTFSIDSLSLALVAEYLC